MTQLDPPTTTQFILRRLVQRNRIIDEVPGHIINWLEAGPDDDYRDEAMLMELRVLEAGGDLSGELSREFIEDFEAAFDGASA